MLRRSLYSYVTFLSGLVTFAILCSFTIFSENANDDDKRIFFIARSKNANIVCYDLNVDKKGLVVEDKPINVYWINKTDHPGERSGLSYIQNKMAYGYDSRYMGKGNYEISLVAFPARKLFLEKGTKGEGYYGRMLINGRQAVLSRIFVQAKPESFLKVAWIELTGTDMENGKTLTERIIPE